MHNQKHDSKLATLSDEQLIERALAAGEQRNEAFAELVKRHQPALLRHCELRCGNADDAADLAQETLLRAYRFLPNFRGESGLRTWLFRIADNQARSLWRKSVWLPNGVDAAELAELPATDAPSGVTQLVQSEVRDTLRELPKPAQDILQLRFDLDLSLNDISRLLGVSLSASKMRLYRALEQFESRYCAAA
jgi:RNA polymerase sigma-70 factor (ECF subfamily)